MSHHIILKRDETDPDPRYLNGGYAHFPGTHEGGGVTCRVCEQARLIRPVKNNERGASEGLCAKARALLGRNPKPISLDAPACRYFGKAVWTGKDLWRDPA